MLCRRHSRRSYPGVNTKDAMLALTPVMNMATLGETTVGQAAEIAQG
jgi:hypothetical protein